MNQKMKMSLALVLACAIVSPTAFYVAYAAPSVDPWHVKIYQLLEKIYNSLTVDIENKLGQGLVGEVIPEYNGVSIQPFEVGNETGSYDVLVYEPPNPKKVSCWVEIEPGLESGDEFGVYVWVKVNGEWKVPYEPMDDVRDEMGFWPTGYLEIPHPVYGNATTVAYLLVDQLPVAEGIMITVLRIANDGNDSEYLYFQVVVEEV